MITSKATKRMSKKLQRELQQETEEIKALIARSNKLSEQSMQLLNDVNISVSRGK